MEQHAAVCSTILTMGFLSLLEIFLVYHDISSPVKLFAAAFLLHLYLRIRWRGAEASKNYWRWPIEWILFGCVVFDRWVHRPRANHFENFVVNPLKSYAIRTTLTNPLAAYRLATRLIRMARWAKWCTPIVQVSLHFNDAIKRWRIVRRQKRERSSRLLTVRRMRSKLSLADSRQVAARVLQAAWRGRMARRHVERQRLSTRLLVRWASARIGDAVRRHRTRLQEQADRRPLLLRPDSSLVLCWKAGVVGLVLLEVASLALIGEDGGQLAQSHSETLGELATRLLWPECATVLVPTGPRSIPFVGPRALMPAPLPPQCETRGSLVQMLGFSPLALLASLVGVLIEVLAVGDTFVEFLMGELDEATGILRPKTPLARYVLPPHSLLFNMAVNPALPTGNRLLGKLLGSDNPYIMFRAVILLQPMRRCLEDWIAPKLRRFLRCRQAKRDAALRRAQMKDAAPTDKERRSLAKAAWVATELARRSSESKMLSSLDKDELPTVDETPEGSPRSVMMG